MNDGYQYRMDIIPAFVLTTFPALTHLQLSHAQMHTLLVDRNETASYLAILELRNNQLTRVDAKVFSWAPNLTSIDLSHNQIQEIESHAFYGLGKLEQLKLNNNRIRNLSRDAFAGAGRLEYLHLQCNDLEFVENDAFDLPQLFEVILRNNNLTTLSDNLFANTPNIELVDVGFNQLKHIGAAFYSRHKIHALNMEGNPIEDIDLERLAGMKSLGRLSLNATDFTLPIKTLEKPACKSTLTHLVLSNNALSNVNIFEQLIVFESLEVLILSDNNFSNFSSTACQVRHLLPKIREINLANNISICEWFWRNKNVFQKLGIRITVGDCGY